MSLRNDLAKNGHFKAPSIYSPERFSVERTSNFDILDTQKERSGSEHEGSVVFTFEDFSPYKYPLTDDRYEVRSDFGPSGLCPLCNNLRHAELDALIVKGLSDERLWKNISFPIDVVLRHLALHIGPVYARVVDSTGELARGLSETRESGRFARSARSVFDEEPSFRKVLAKVREAVRYESRYDAEEKRARSFTIDIIPPSLAPPSAKKQTNAWVREDVAPVAPVGKERYSAKEYHLAHDSRGAWYAFDGKKEKGPLRLWGESRMGTELEKRTHDAINFYDEMLAVRSMSMRVYSEIMDSDIELANEEEEQRADAEGRKPRYIERNYPAAINAAKLRKDVATDMAKLALIAQKYGEESAGKRQLSPTIQAMLDDLGIYSDLKVPDPAIDKVDSVEFAPLGSGDEVESDE